MLSMELVAEFCQASRKDSSVLLLVFASHETLAVGCTVSTRAAEDDIS